MRVPSPPWVVGRRRATQLFLFLLSLDFSSIIQAQLLRKPDLLVAEGERFVQLEDVSGARVRFESALLLDPNHVGALEDLSLLLLLAGEDRLALVKAESLLALSPSDEEGLIVEAIALVNLRQGERAVGLLSRPVVKNIRQEDPLFSAVLGSALNDCKGTPLCKSELQRDARSNPSHPQLQDVLFAGQSFRAPSLRKVLDVWVEDLSHDPNQTTEDLGRLFTVVGQEELLQGEATEAGSHLARAIELGPCNVPARVALSKLQRDRGAISDSDTNLYQAKRCIPFSESDGVRLADEFMRLKMFVDARNVLLTMQKAGYADERLLYREGVCQFRIGDSEAAEKSFRLALKNDPTSGETKTALAVVLLATSRSADGTKMLEEVVASGKATAQVYFYLADQERGKSNLNRAEELLAAAIKLAPNDARPYAALGRLHTEEGKLQEAESDLHQALQCDASLEIAHYYLAGLYRKEGKQSAAGDEMKLFQKFHAEERNRGIVGLQVSDIWEYPGFLPSGKETATAP